MFPPVEKGAMLYEMLVVGKQESGARPNIKPKMIGLQDLETAKVSGQGVNRPLAPTRKIGRTYP